MEWPLNFKMQEKILVTGATGFLGGAVTRHLANMGLPVVGQGRNPMLCSDLTQVGVQPLQWDITQPISPRQMKHLDGITTIVHCAGLSVPFGKKQAFRTANVEGTKALITLAKALSVQRFVLISSPSVYFSLKDQTNVTEDHILPKPFNHYAWSKVEAEKLVLSASEIGPVILRPRGLYGPDDTTLLPRLLATAKARPFPIFRQGVARIDLTYIEDAVDAILSAICADKTVIGRIYNISGGQVLNVSDIVEQTCARANVPVRWHAISLRPALAIARIAEAVALMKPRHSEPHFTRYGLALFAFEQSLNIERAQTELGWSPKICFEDGLRRTFAAGAA